MPANGSGRVGHWPAPGGAAARHHHWAGGQCGWLAWGGSLPSRPLRAAAGLSPWSSQSPAPPLSAAAHRCL